MMSVQNMPQTLISNYIVPCIAIFFFSSSSEALAVLNVICVFRQYYTMEE